MEGIHLIPRTGLTETEAIDSVLLFVFVVSIIMMIIGYKNYMWFFAVGILTVWILFIFDKYVFEDRAIEEIDILH